MVSTFNRRQILAPGTVITASGSVTGLAIGEDDVTALNLYATITAVSGTTPSITFAIAFANDAVPGTFPPASYGTASSGAAQTATGADVVVATGTDAHTVLDVDQTRYYEVTWTVTGTTPSFTIGALYTDN